MRKAKGTLAQDAHPFAQKIQSLYWHNVSEAGFVLGNANGQETYVLLRNRA
jgi:hypothetical protein